MPPERDIDESIRMHLSVLAYNIENSNQRNLQDINIYGEGVVCGLLNLLWGVNLVELNRENEGNFPSIDLMDQNAGLFIQVTSEDSLDKIRKTLEKSKKASEKIKNQVKPQILLLRFNKKKRKADIDLGGETFANKDILCLNELSLAIQNCKSDQKSRIHDFILEKIPIPQGKGTNFSLEVYTLRKLFQSVSSLELADPDNELITSPSELERKREIYSEFWQNIQLLYRSVFDQKREEAFRAAFDRLGQGERIRLVQYLKFESNHLLYELNIQDPNKVIQALRDKIIGDIRLPLIPEMDVTHFLYFEFRNCNVLPLMEPVLE